MSIARVLSFAFSGIEPVPVEVQVQIASGLPAFLVVGLPDKAVAQSRERVRAALAGLGLSLPPKRVLVNLAPADIAKEGSHLDLPIALAVLAAMDVLPREELAGYAALGELSLGDRAAGCGGAGGNWRTAQTEPSVRGVVGHGFPDLHQRLPHGRHAPKPLPGSLVLD